MTAFCFRPPPPRRGLSPAPTTELHLSTVRKRWPRLTGAWGVKVAQAGPLPLSGPTGPLPAAHLLIVVEGGHVLAQMLQQDFNSHVNVEGGSLERSVVHGRAFPL